MTNQSQAVAVSIAKWQSIESAPKDGTRVLLFGREGGCAGYGVGFWGKHDHVPLYGWVVPIPGRWEVEEVSPPPTHWMPLPQAPSDQEEVRQPDSDVASLVAENERLRLEKSDLRNSLLQAMTEARVLRTQLAEAQKDAQRYRIWRAAYVDNTQAQADDFNGLCLALCDAWTADDVDREIDAALTPKEQP